MTGRSAPARALHVTLRVNGAQHKVALHGNERMVDVLRDILGFKSVKEACGSGACGLCTVLVDGKPVHSCLMMAFQGRGKAIMTGEGLGDERHLHPLQQAFIDAGAVQCGYCIPAALLTAKGLLDAQPDPPREEIRRALRSVLCRCGSYLRFEEAILSVAGGVAH
jgi:carbon-monoxide dehydrogenase small subunit